MRTRSESRTPQLIVPAFKVVPRYYKSPTSSDDSLPVVVVPSLSGQSRVPLSRYLANVPSEQALLLEGRYTKTFVGRRKNGGPNHERHLTVFLLFSSSRFRIYFEHRLRLYTHIYPAAPLVLTPSNPLPTKPSQHCSDLSCYSYPESSDCRRRSRTGTSPAGGRPSVP